MAITPRNFPAAVQMIKERDARIKQLEEENARLKEALHVEPLPMDEAETETSIEE